jgi:tetratricopeptide (TPR) repeat protein
MDSQRRHELEQNSLYQALAKLPTFAVEYGAYILLGVAVVVALYYFFHTRRTAAQQELEAEAVGVYSMVETVDAAEQFRRLAGFVTPEEMAQRQADFASDFEAFSLLPSTSERPGVKARALRLRGDFNWTLASYPEPRSVASTSPSTQPSTQSSTQPSTRGADDLLFPPTTRQSSPAEAYLREAEAAYREVLDTYPEQTADNMAALFGLAAIAEQRGQFAEAAKYYDRLVEREDAPEGSKSLARQRKGLLQTLALNPRLAKSIPPATRPATVPSTQPATGPATGPATRPV